MPTVAAIQMTSTDDLKHNLAQAEDLIKQAAESGAKLIVLPEMFAIMGMDQKLILQEALGTGPIQKFLSTQAKLHKIWLVGGTIPITSPEPNRVYAACLVYDNQGELQAQYNKIHLFDVCITEGIETYQESKLIYPGNQPCVIDTPLGKLGLAVCYDLRFPELFRTMCQQGAEIIALPAAFTQKTGNAHWEILLRARAIENFCYIIGACQTGQHNPERQTHGHSMLVHPWGNVLSELSDEIDYITADLDLQQTHELRKNIPILTHQKLKILT